MASNELIIDDEYCKAMGSYFKNKVKKWINSRWSISKSFKKLKVRQSQAVKFPKHCLRTLAMYKS